MERQAKDGTIYRQVGADSWEPVTRAAKDGVVYQKVGSDQWKPLEGPKIEEPSAGDKAWAGLEGMTESVTLGALPYMKAGVESAMNWGLQKTHGFKDDGATFDERVARAREQGKADQAKAPGYALAGQVAGFIAPGAVAARLTTKGLQAASTLPGVGRAAQGLAQSGNARDLYKAAQIAKQAGDATKASALVSAARADLMRQGAKLGIEGAALGAAYTPESGFSDIGSRVSNAAVGFGTGALVPPALRGAGNVARGTGAAAGWAGKKALSSVGGVSEKVIERYLKNPERIRGAQTFDELYERVTGVVGKLADDLDQSKIDHDSASKQLDEVARGIKDSRVEGKAAALEEVQRARVMLDESFNAQKRTLQDKASPSRLETMVSDALENQKGRVSQGSKESFEILGNQSGAANIDNVVSAVDDIESGLYIGSGSNKVLKNDSADVGVKLLDKWRSKLYALSDEKGNIPFKTLKEVIQGIDSDMRKHGNRMASDFNESAEQAMFALRKSIDRHLKSITPYAEKMATVADDSTVLNEANRAFGKDSIRISRLQNIARPSSKYDLDTLRALGAREGGDLTRSIDDVVEAQRTLKSPLRLENIQRSLPENQGLRQADMKAAAAKRLAKPSAVRQAIERSGAFHKSRSAKAKLETAKNLANKFKGFGEQTAEAKLKQVAQGRKFATKTLKELSELADEDFVEAVHAASDAAAFTKTAFNGSRNVNLWTVIGALGQSAVGKGGAGGAAGFIFGGPVGMAVGAMTGAMMDVYGPRVTKKILDGVINIKGPITERAIQAIDLPEPVKRELVSQFRSAILTGRAAKGAASTRLPKVSENNELDRDSSAPAMYRDDRE